MVDLVQVTGLRELEKQLLALGQEYGPKAAASPIRYALGKAGKVVQASAQARVRRKTGTLAENIIVTTDKKAPEGQLGVKVTVRAKARAYKSNSRAIKQGRIGLEYNFYGPLFYGKFIEFGHDIVNSDGRVVGHAPAYSFMGAAFDATKGSLPNLIRDELVIAIARSVRRLGGK